MVKPDSLTSTFEPVKAASARNNGRSPQNTGPGIGAIDIAQWRAGHRLVELWKGRPAKRRSVQTLVPSAIRLPAPSHRQASRAVIRCLNALPRKLQVSLNLTPEAPATSLTASQNPATAPRAVQPAFGPHVPARADSSPAMRRPVHLPNHRVDHRQEPRR